MSPAPMYGSFAVVTLLVLSILVLLARASQAMLDGSGVTEEHNQSDDHDQSDGRDTEIPATGAARIEHHPETGQSRVERREQEILDKAESDTDETRPVETEADGTHTGETDGNETAAQRTEADETAQRTKADADETTRQTKADTEETAQQTESDTEEVSNEITTPQTDADKSESPWEEDSETPWGENPAEADAQRIRKQAPPDFSTGTLLANVALSQGLFGAVLLGAAWLAEIPPAALGVTLGDPSSVGLPAVATGIAVGIALYVGNELAAVVVDALGVDYSEGLRESLAPETLGGWFVLLLGVLPIIAGFEELLFRAALIGAFATGFGLSPWFLAAFSTAAFAVGHGAQGPGGVAVTGLLGFALAAAYILTGSLLVVIVAHYLVNALEFVVHEGFGIEWV